MASLRPVEFGYIIDSSYGMAWSTAKTLPEKGAIHPPLNVHSKARHGILTSSSGTLSTAFKKYQINTRVERISAYISNPFDGP